MAECICVGLESSCSGVARLDELERSAIHGGVTPPRRRIVIGGENNPFKGSLPQ